MSYVTLTSIFRKDVDTRFGIKPKVGIKTQEHGDKWLSTFKTKGTEDWAEGMKVEVNISESGDFLNFNPVLGGGSTGSTGSAPAKASPELEGRVKKLEDAVFGGSSQPSVEVIPASSTPQTDVETTLEDEFDTGF